MEEMRPLDGVSAIALIMIASFAIDRIVTAVLFLLSFIPGFPDPNAALGQEQLAYSQKLYKLCYFSLAGVLGVLAMAAWAQIRILSALGVPAGEMTDILITGIVLMGGADRIASVLKTPGASGVEKKAEAEPVRVTGTLIVEEESPRKVVSRGA